MEVVVQEVMENIIKRKKQKNKRLWKVLDICCTTM